MIEKIKEYFGLSKITRKIICLDFDGVIHSYKQPWINARFIPDPPVKGMITWIEDFLWEHCDIPDSISCFCMEGKYEISIFSSRSKYFGGIKAMKKYLVKHGLEERLLEAIKFPVTKPAAFLTIDDRVHTFDGDPGKLNLVIKNFTPWNKRSI